MLLEFNRYQSSKIGNLKESVHIINKVSWSNFNAINIFIRNCHSCFSIKRDNLNSSIINISCYITDFLFNWIYYCVSIINSFFVLSKFSRIQTALFYLRNQTKNLKNLLKYKKN